MVQMALHPSSFLIAMTPLRPVDRGLAPHEHAVHGVAADLGAADRGLPLGLHDDPVLPAVLDDAVLDLRDAMHNHASQSGVVYP